MIQPVEANSHSVLCDLIAKQDATIQDAVNLISCLAQFALSHPGYEKQSHLMGWSKKFLKENVKII